LTQLSLKIPGNSHIESFIDLSDVIKLLIPTETVDVIKVNKIVQASALENFKCPGHSLVMSAAAKKLVKGIDNEEHVDKCVKCRYYPYSIVTEDTALDFIAQGFLSFKYLSQALDYLFQNKKLAKRLASWVEVVGTV